MGCLKRLSSDEMTTYNAYRDETGDLPCDENNLNEILYLVQKVDSDDVFFC